MSNFLGTIGGTDVTQYLKGFSVNPGGDGVVGDGVLWLDKSAGGLTIRPMMDVRIWRPFNPVGGAGVAAGGRLLGGRIKTRDTSPVGVTQLWRLTVWDYNVILTKVVRPVALALVISAGHFNTGVSNLVNSVQNNNSVPPPVQIDTTGVADLVTSMPAVTYEGGHTLLWYLQQYMALAQSVTPALRPRMYVGVQRTFGALDVFGGPLLNIYNGALAPTTVADYSDTPTGGQKKLLGTFRRVTDPTAMVQWRQAVFGNGLVVTGREDASADTYPNDYINSGRGSGNQGFWGAEPVEDRVSTTFAAAQAAIDLKVRATGYPRDTYSWETEEALLPGDYVNLKYDLEGISSLTPFRVARAQYTIEDPDVVNAKLTINSRRLGLLEDGTTGIEGVPIENPSARPLPPTSVTNSPAGGAWDSTYNAVVFHLAWTPSPSPSAAGYRAIGTVNGQPTNQDLGQVAAGDLYLPEAVPYSLQVFAYNAAGQLSPGAPVSPLTGTTASYIPDALIRNASFEMANRAVTTEAWMWFFQPVNNASGARTNAQHVHGSWCYQLVHGTTNVNDIARVNAYQILLPGSDADTRSVIARFKGNAGGEIAQIQLLWQAEDGTPLGISHAEFTVSTNWDTYELLASPPLGTFPVKGIISLAEFDSTTSAKKIWADAVEISAVSSSKSSGYMTPPEKAVVADARTRTKFARDRAKTSYTLTEPSSSGTKVKRDNGSTDMSVTFTLAATTDVLVEFYARYFRVGDGGAGRTRFAVKDGSTTILPDSGAGDFNGTWVLDDEHAVYFKGVVSLGSGSHTLKVEHQGSYSLPTIDFRERYLAAEVLG